MTARLHHNLMCLVVFFEEDFFIKKQIKVEGCVTGKEMDEFICDVFEFYKEIELINNEHVENSDEENEKND